jgi:hypothetical protein
VGHDFAGCCQLRQERAEEENCGMTFFATRAGCSAAVTAALSFSKGWAR